MRRLDSEIDIEIEDENGEKKKYTLRYDLNALAKFEEIYDKAILEVFAPSLDEHGNMMVDRFGKPLNLNLRIGMLRDMIWVGMLARQPDITQDEVGAMFDPREIDEIFTNNVISAVSASNKQVFPPDPVVEKERKAHPKK